MKSLAILVVLLSAAQTRWKEIGKTGDGNIVSVDQRSVKRTGDRVDATVRVKLVKPKKTAGGDVTSSRTVISLNCKTHDVAIKEYTFYFDEAKNRVFQRSVARQPGFSPVMGGSMTQVAYDALCKK